MRGEAQASLENALEMLLSRTSLDLGPRVSYHTSNHPIETQKLSLLLCSMRVDPKKTGEREGQARLVCWVARFRGSSYGPDAMDCRPRRMIAVSEADNVVLNKAIDALNVVPKTH